MMKIDKQFAIVIPVFNPEPGLHGLCEKALAMRAVTVVVNDGSVSEVAAFEKLPRGVEVVKHAVNRGKGRAIKTALEYLAKVHPDVMMAVFADGDGQHAPEDIARVVAACHETDHLTLGVRDFSSAGIPFRSRFGNVLTSWLVRRFFGFPVYDTQTGLRAIPARLFKAMCELPGERFEYEMRLFGFARRQHEPIDQVPIKTIYIASNRASHFRPIVDSIKIYKGLFEDAACR